jgi:fatty acid-binding protein DegV
MKYQKIDEKAPSKKSSIPSLQQMIEVYQPIDESDVLLIHSIFRLILCHYAM